MEEIMLLLNPCSPSWLQQTTKGNIFYYELSKVKLKRALEKWVIYTLLLTFLNVASCMALLIGHFTTLVQMEICWLQLLDGLPTKQTFMVPTGCVTYDEPLTFRLAPRGWHCWHFCFFILKNIYCFQALLCFEVSTHRAASMSVEALVYSKLMSFASDVIYATQLVQLYINGSIDLI